MHTMYNYKTLQYWQNILNNNKKTLIKIKNISIEAPVIDKYDDIENYLLNNKEIITKLGN